jgi:hypothetical protein
VELGFPNPHRARKAGRALCLLTRSQQTRLLLLESENPLCSRLLIEGGGGERGAVGISSTGGSVPAPAGGGK